jgi:hypothetical protein
VAVRFYVDADTLGLAKVMVRLRWDVTYPGDPGGTVKRHSRKPCEVAAVDIDDDVWIPIVAANGWAVISRDKKIARRPAEIAAIRSAGAKMFAIASTEKLDVWRQLEVLLCNWRRVEDALSEPGPYIYRLTRTGMTRLI